MTDTDEALEEFFRDVDDVYGEYEQGYADADATLRRLEKHIDNLRETVENE